jgi:hypothetical protein
MITGCAVRSTGDPIPAGAPDQSDSSVTATDPRVADLLPPRSRELDLAGVDPCTSLLTDRQLRDLDYDLGYARPPKAGRSKVHNGSTCTFSSSELSGGAHRNRLTLVGISTTEGALATVTGPTLPTVVAVQEFSALVLPNPILSDSCLVVVDTADGQYLDVSSGPVRAEDTDQSAYCEEAERVARMAIQTIVSSR